MQHKSNLLFHSGTALLSAGLFAVSFETEMTSCCVFVCLALLVASCETLPLKHACIYGGVSGSITWLLVLRWVIADGPSLMATGVWMGLSLVGVLHWTLFAAAVSLYRQRVCRLVLLPVLWALLEISRNWVLIGCPWYFLSYPLADWWYGIYAASLIGATGLSAATVIVNLCVKDAFHAAINRDGWRGFRTLSAALGLPTMLHICGWLMIAHNPSAEHEILVGVMQTNFVSERTADWDATEMCREWSDLGQELRSARPDVIVTPESCLPNPAAWAEYLHRNDRSVPDEWQFCSASKVSSDTSSEKCSSVLGQIPVLSEQTYIIGATVSDSTDTAQKGNSLLFLNRDGHLQNLYLKQACLPFFEQTYWGVLDDEEHSVVPAEADQAVVRQIRSNDGSPAYVAPLICYEDSLPSIYEHYCDQARQNGKAIFFVASGNEALCPSIRRTHLQLVRWRAVEFGVPIVRAVNSGQSAHIDSLGQIQMNLGDSAHGPADTGTTGIARVAPRVPKTFYSAYRRHLMLLYVEIIVLFAARRIWSLT